MSYVGFSVVVDGAEDQVAEVPTVDDLVPYVETIERDALTYGLPTEVYVIEHDHDMDDGECSCIQYLTDHHPRWSWNV